MDTFGDSRIEYADFTFECSKVVCYGLLNRAGGTTTILNFQSVRLADLFEETFLTDRNFQVVRNEAQVICLTDYDTVMRKSGDDPRIRFMTHNRDFMTGTLAHLA